MANLILKNAKQIDGQLVNIIIEDEKIKKIKKTLNTSDINTDKIVDVKDNIIIPGLIDTHVHFRDPGLTNKETWKTGSQAASHGGYTTVIDMPNTNPKTDTLKKFKDKKQIALKKSNTDFALHAGVKTQKDVNEILSKKPASYKIFMDLHTNDELEDMFRYLEGTNKPVTLHCEDKRLVDYNIKTLKEDPSNDDKIITYSYARSALAEHIAVNQAINLAEKYNLQLHLCHISTRSTLELIHAAKNPNITIEATPHHLFLDNSTYETYGSRAKTNPPLRDKTQNITIRMLDKFDSIGTDHAPHTINEKTKNTWDTASGIPNLETTLKLLLTEVNNKNLTLTQVVNKTSKRPAEIFNIPNKGRIAEGFDGDITILNMKQTGVIDPQEFYTKGKYTPFEGMKYQGNNIMTINRGYITSEDDMVFENTPKYVY